MATEAGQIEGTADDVTVGARISPASRSFLGWQLVQLAGLAAFAIGVALLHFPGADPAAAVRAAIAELPLTLPAAVLVVAGLALNISAGAVVMRAAIGQPYRGPAQLVLFGFAGAVVIDLVLMTLLGLVGLFTQPILIAINVAVVAGGAMARFRLGGRWRLTERWRPALTGLFDAGPLGWLLVAAIWVIPVIVQLASPVVPFNDVPPNHVAPVEHLREFGSLTRLDLTFSPIYGPSRIFLGYQAIVGAVATMGSVLGATAVAAFALPLLILISLAAACLARAIAGGRAGQWALLLVPLTVTFLRVNDARAGVLVFPLAALALWLLIEPMGATPRRQSLSLALVLAAAIYVHPLIGLFAAATVGIASLAVPNRYGFGLSAAIAAPILALPQIAAQLDIDSAAAFALIAIPAAALVLYALETSVIGRVAPGRMLPALLLIALAIGAAAVALVPEGRNDAINGVNALITDYPMLLIAAGVGIAASWRQMRGLGIFAAALLACFIAGTVGGALAGISLLTSSLSYEVGKSVTYYAPTLLATVGAAGLGALWMRWQTSSVLRLGGLCICGVLLVIGAAYPVGVKDAETLGLGEHRWSEAAAISLAKAANGYWLGYPDSRTLIGPNEQRLVDGLRAEVAAGRLTPDMNVLHIAHTWRSDVSPSYTTPLGVFAGVVETMASADPEVSANTIGGRLRDLKDLDSMLGPEYPYVVTEGGGLPSDLPTELADAGYSLVFSSPKGSIYRLSNG